MSAGQSLMTQTTVSTKFSGHKAFLIAPSMWNDLPVNIHQADSAMIFKELLKNHFVILLYTYISLGVSTSRTTIVWVFFIVVFFFLPEPSLFDNSRLKMN